MSKVYSVFISHSWNNIDDLINLRNLLNNRGYFNVEFKEVAPMNPINSENSNYIKSQLRNKIKESDILLGIAGIYASYSDWMEWEMSIAKEYGINVIGVIPRGNQYVSNTVKKYSIENVRWDTESVVQAIRTYGK